MRVDKSKWHKDLLGNLCNIKRGGSPRPIQKFLTDDSNGINWIKIGDAGDSKFISSCKEKIIQEGVSKSRFVHKGDFLLSNSMSFGRPYILNVDGCIHDGWLVLEQPKQFDKTYLYYLLGSAPMYEKFAKKAQGAVVNNLNIERVASIEIAYPPLNIQQSIASELDAVQEMIDGYKAQIADLDALAQSIFLDMFGDPVANPKGWEKDILSNIVSCDCCISYGIVQPGDEVEDGVPVVRPVDLISTYVERKALKKVAKSISDSYKRTILTGDELLICVRGTTGIVSMSAEDLKGCNVTRGIVPLSFDKHEKWFIYHCIKTPQINSEIQKHTKGATLRQINIKDLRELEFPLPPLPLQQLFATKVEAIEQQKEQLRLQLQDAETLMAERMQYYFS